MSTIMGKDGYVIVAMGIAPTVTLAIPCIDTWSMNIAGDAIDVTGFGTTSSVIFRSFQAGLKSATGNAAGSLDGADTSLSTLMSVMHTSAQTTVNCVFFMDANHHVSVACIITGFTEGAAVADKTTFGFDFQVTGAPNYA